jgi:2'-5' RNA ligase
MPERLSIPRYRTSRQAKNNLFFAVFPEADAAIRTQRLAHGLRDKYGLKGDPLETGRFHVSLHGFGRFVELPQDIVDAASEAAATISFPPFRVSFNHALSFARPSSNRPLVLLGDEGVIGLEMLYKALAVALAKAGLARWVTLHYTPHMTLLYDDLSVAEQSVEPVEWTVREFVLVHSLVGETQHVPLKRWPLRG